MISLKLPFLPTEDYPITQGFGANPAVYSKLGMPGHNGLDFGCPAETRLCAPADGVVINSELHKSYGNIVKIKHNGGYFTLFAHMNKCLVKVGDAVKTGDLIGLSGMTGFSTGPHLHFGLQSVKEGTKPYNYYIDPKPALSINDKAKKK